MSITPGTPCLLLDGIPEAGNAVMALRVASNDELQKALGLPTDIPFTYRGTCWHIDRETTWTINSQSERVMAGLVKARLVGERYLLPLRDPDADVAETQDREVTA